jgi:hypothetical protein
MDKLASASSELTRRIADYTNGPWPTAAPHRAPWSGANEVVTAEARK